NRWQQGSTQIKAIAKPHAIPQHYLEQILVTLKKAGLVESFRGAHGGYSLAKNPSSITVMEILQHLEGQLEVTPDNTCANTLSFFWNDVSEVLHNKLNLTLDQLALEQVKQSQQLSYSI
ncbi:MAG: RrF2 family transcriptional regulator, partial [Spirochaetota bacterium]